MIYTETLLDLKNLQFRRELEALNKSLYSLLLNYNNDTRIPETKVLASNS